MAETRPRRGSWKALAVCAGLLVLAGIFESSMQPAGVSLGYLANGKDRNAAVAEAAGEFRVAAANLLWDKVVDHYHHQYMAEGGDWEQNESLLPLLQNIITLDPHFVEAYELMGGTILPKTGHVAQGEAVLAKGIKYNPYDWELYREMAMLYAWTEHKPGVALPYARAGLKQADDAFSQHLMALLCRTLQDRVRKEHGTAGPGVTAALTDQSPVPAPSKTLPRSHPSVSG